MNKRYLNSALIVLLVIIWGAVIYKYFGSKKSSKKNEVDSNVFINQDYHLLAVKDTFVLELKNDGPFKISSKIKTYRPKKDAKNNTKTPKKIINKNIVWPTITYHGFVKGENNTTRLILLKIDNRLYRKREKSQVKNIVLIKAYNDSLEVSFNGNNKIIKRQ